MAYELEKGVEAVYVNSKKGAGPINRVYKQLEPDVCAALDLDHLTSDVPQAVYIVLLILMYKEAGMLQIAEPIRMRDVEMFKLGHSGGLGVIRE